MGLPREMEEEERGVFRVDGATGMAIATGLLLSILVFLSVKAISVQKAEAMNTYKILDIHELKAISNENQDSYQLVNQEVY
jgi:hypothetical protein